MKATALIFMIFVLKKEIDPNLFGLHGTDSGMVPIISEATDRILHSVQGI
jgi:hypothetical protein